jgi:hypothetical protein
MTTHELAAELLALKELPLADETSLRDARNRLGLNASNPSTDEYGMTAADYDPYNG